MNSNTDLLWKFNFFHENSRINIILSWYGGKFIHKAKDDKSNKIFHAIQKIFSEFFVSNSFFT